MELISMGFSVSNEVCRVTVFTKDSFRITQLPGYCAQSEYGLSTGVDGVAELSR